MKCKLCKGEGFYKIDDDVINRCSICDGTGEVAKCRNCNGAGTFTRSFVTEWKIVPCMTCIGNGMVPKRLYDCQACDNTGIIMNSHTVYYDDGSKELMYEPDICGCKE